MSFSRHHETDELTKRVNSTFQQLLCCFYCYNGTKWTNPLPQVEFAYNGNRALGIEHTTFEANFGFSLEEPLDLLLRDPHCGHNNGHTRTLYSGGVLALLPSR
jgi:hypothetical protein